MKKMAMKGGVMVVLFVAQIFLATAQENNFEKGFVYIKPIESSQKEYSIKNEITYFKIYIDNELTFASNNVDELDEYIALDKFNSWKSREKRSIKIVYTLNNEKDITYIYDKQVKVLEGQDICLLN